MRIEKSRINILSPSSKSVSPKKKGQRELKEGNSGYQTKLKIVSWNVRGLSDKEKRNLMKMIIINWNADIYIVHWKQKSALQISPSFDNLGQQVGGMDRNGCTRK